MTLTTLVYHRDSRTSVFYEQLFKVARCSHLRIACPYVDYNQLELLVANCERWTLLTDLEAWLSITSKNSAKRKSTLKFIDRHRCNIRHRPYLHAKVFLGDDKALLGSANLTEAGLLDRTEMGVFTTDSQMISELHEWFGLECRKADSISELDLSSLETIPDSIPIKPTRIGNPLPLRKTVPDGGIPVDAKIRILKRAKGYLVPNSGNKFCVLKDSLAVLENNSLGEYGKNGQLLTKKRTLIEDGTLAVYPNDRLYLVFTKDCVFSSPSAAASIILSRPVDGKREWGLDY